MASSQHTSHQTSQKFNNAGKPLPDVGLKWGKTPKSTAADPMVDTASTTDLKPEQDWENFYSEEEKDKLRKKGINPALKAEMDAKRKSNGKESGFWGKVAQTAMGGSFIK